MQPHKIVRTICYFTDTFDIEIYRRLQEVEKSLHVCGYTIQTKRICSKDPSIASLCSMFDDPSLYLSVGTLNREAVFDQFNDFLHTENVALNLNLTDGVLPEDCAFLFNLIKKQPRKTFSFAYTFCNLPSSPYFPSATYQKPGFSIGLQPTDLSIGCETLDAWFKKMDFIWNEICQLFDDRFDFLGIDSSIAPLFTGKSSLIHFVKNIQGSFSRSVTTDLFLQISHFIKENNPKPVGLCGIMFPCLEDFELAQEYESGNFSIERNIYLSLHCGLGIDTYPIGINESPQRVFDILCLLQGLSKRYRKSLSVRFISDGKAKIGDKTDLRNRYLKDVTVIPL